MNSRRNVGMRHPDFKKGVCESHTTKSLQADIGVSTFGPTSAQDVPIGMKRFH